jgi:hypothetical protein
LSAEKNECPVTDKGCPPVIELKADMRWVKRGAWASIAQFLTIVGAAIILLLGKLYNHVEGEAVAKPSQEVAGEQMNRKEFTKTLGMLIVDMILKGEEPILDYVKRSDEEQARLFERELSKCDGIANVSRHQRGCAADIYFPDERGNLMPPKLGWKFWHKRWEDLSYGKAQPMIDQDKSHFE